MTEAAGSSPSTDGPARWPAVPAHTNALDFLRGVGLTGAKEGCAEGECGACAVMVARPGDGDGSRWTPVNACLVPAAALDGQEVVTAEGLGSPDAPAPRPGRARGARRLAVRLLHARLRLLDGRRVLPARPDSHRRPRRRALRQRLRPPRHRRQPLPLHRLPADPRRRRRARHRAGGRPVRRAPDEAPHRRACPPGSTGSPGRPTSREALALLAEHPDATVVAGSTDWGVEVNLRGRRASYVVAVDRLPELRALSTGDVVEIGAALTLSEVEAGLGGSVPLLAQVWPLFASRLIRNGATIGGNLGTASPIGDLAPALLALEATLVLASSEGDREVALADFFTGYRETVLRPTELIRSVRIPTPLVPLTTFRKISKRRLDDISSVAVGAALDVVDGTVVKARIGLGGVAATPIRALATEAALEGRPWSLATVEEAAAVMAGEGTPIDDQRASAAYRSAMLGNALRAWWHEGSREGESR